MQAEREIASFYAALFMQDKVGERFRGVVASVVEFGLFVELEPWFVEGLVKIEDLGDDWEHDPDLHALVQRGTGRAFRVGDRVEVELTAASPARRQIDLALVEKSGALAGASRDAAFGDRARAVESGVKVRRGRVERDVDVGRGRVPRPSKSLEKRGPSQRQPHAKHVDRRSAKKTKKKAGGHASARSGNGAGKGGKGPPRRKR
jgi:ribonuclease R